MSIAVTTVRTRVRKITRRDNETEFPDTDLDALILEACLEISKRLLCIKTDTTGTLAGDGTSLSAPSDMVDSQQAIDNFYLDSVVLDPLTFDEWRQGNVRGYAYRDSVIYITPTSDNDRSYTLYYDKVHGAISTNLEFDDDLKMAAIWLTCKKVFENYLADADDVVRAQKAEREYEREISINGPAEVIVTRQRQTRE